MVKSTAKGWLTQSLAEFIGTAMCMYVSVGGADAIADDLGESGYLGRCFAFGIGLVVTAWAFFRISGSHFNPAVSLSSLITGHLTVPKFVLYFVSQLLGAMLGVALVRGTTPSSESIMQVNSLVRSVVFLFDVRMRKNCFVRVECWMVSASPIENYLSFYLT